MILFLALLLDAALGEPRWLWSRIWHPAVAIGNLIGWADERFNYEGAQRPNGVLLCASLVAGGAVLGIVISELPFGWLLELIVVAILLAQRSLIDHVQAVADALRLSVGDGRLTVGRIVGRDTSEMDGPAVARAAIESAAENFSDGIVAPVFWYLLLGLPGILIYKAINTADSMIGYRTPRHQEFGWASARLDDILNWVPARLTALILMACGGAWSSAQVIWRDAKLHRSPNAGWPEAAMAVSLNVALAGPRSYDGEMQEFPFVHPAGKREPGPEEIDAAIKLLWRAWMVLLVIALLSPLA